MSKIRKAIAAFLTAAAGAVATKVITDGVPSDGAGWAALLGAAVGVGMLAALTVYGVRNAPPHAEAVAEVQRWQRP